MAKRRRDKTVHVFGIRHHGPGSAKCLRAALERLRPDYLLVEGPPEANDLLPLAADPQMEPPVALLLYLKDRPATAAYYPFVAFSPEWQAIRYALKRRIPVRFMDLEWKAQLALEDEQSPPSESPPGPATSADPSQEPAEATEPAEVAEPSAPSEPSASSETSATPSAASEWPLDAADGVPGPADARSFDPFAVLAAAAGLPDAERWWECVIEERRRPDDVFEGILELMAALRAEAERLQRLDPHDLVREAAMRTIIRAAMSEGHATIAVVCGAWHAPALVQLNPEAQDKQLLAEAARRTRSRLGAAAVAATWIPWTNDRLARRSGYGAGVDAPGWYEHLWETDRHVVESWMVKVARLMRDEGLDLSPAHAIEAARLAETLAALRGRTLPGLPEMEEAVQTVFCHGDDAPLRLIRERLLVGHRLGRVPPHTPTVPLQQDIAAAQKRTRLLPSPEPQTLDLDLRKPLLLERSRLLHRMRLLGIPWGEVQQAGRSRGTFHEIWRIQWQPEFAVRIIEASVWGHTLPEAAAAKTLHAATTAQELPELTELLDAALLADLPQTVPLLTRRIQQVMATGADVPHLMQALPPLVNIRRYGAVRKFDAPLIQHIIDELLARICVGLPNACAALNDDAAAEMAGHIEQTHRQVFLLDESASLPAEHAAATDQPSPMRDWLRVLTHLAEMETGHGRICGLAARLLYDQRRDEETARRMSRALSPGTPAPHTAAWLEGFLSRGGQVLLHDDGLWQIIDGWVGTVAAEQFVAQLPLLRRTFSRFSAAERRQIGEKARHGGQVLAVADHTLDAPRADRALTLVRLILGPDGTPDGKSAGKSAGTPDSATHPAAAVAAPATPPAPHPAGNAQPKTPAPRRRRAPGDPP